MFVLQNTIDDTTQNHIHKIISVDQWKPDTAVYLRFQHLPHWSLRKKAENKSCKPQKQKSFCKPYDP